MDSNSFRLCLPIFYLERNQLSVMFLFGLSCLHFFSLLDTTEIFYESARLTGSSNWKYKTFNRLKATN